MIHAAELGFGVARPEVLRRACEVSILTPFELPQGVPPERGRSCGIEGTVTALLHGCFLKNSHMMSLALMLAADLPSMPRIGCRPGQVCPPPSIA